VVVATWIARRDDSASSVLDLLVLWRGTPGWFTKGEAAREQTFGDQSGRTTLHLFRGGINLELTFDPQRQTAELQGKAVDLRDRNVILVDGVDMAGGLKVVGTDSVDPRLTGSPVRIQEVLRRSEKLVTFLRCHERLADAKLQAMMDLLCSQVNIRK
jgi:hypothetical protein